VSIFGFKRELTRLTDAIQKRDEQIAALAERITYVATRLETLERSPARSESGLSAGVALVTALGHLANASSENTKTQVELITRLLDRSARAAFSATASELAKRSVAKRAEKKRAQEAAARENSEEGKLWRIARACEECAAKLDGRPPATTRDMMRHAAEKHDQYVLPLLNGGADGDGSGDQAN
jgi:hypothetical protein